MSDAITKTIEIVVIINPLCPDSITLAEQVDNILSEFSPSTFNLKVIDIWHNYDEFVQFIKECKTTKTIQENFKQINNIFGLVFVNKKEVSGVPLNELKLKNAILQELDQEPIDVPLLDLDLSELGWFAKPRKDFDIRRVKTELVNEDNIRYLVDLCMKYNPLRGEAPERSDRAYFTSIKAKMKWFLEINNLFGPNAILAFYQDQVLGFIEFLPREFARKAGVICGSDSKKKVITITCLSVRKNFQRLGIGKKLVHRLEKYAKKRGYKYLEVGAFRGNTNWQPIAFYKKLGFYKVVNSTIGNRCIMQKKLD